jgi:3'-phosphoadenosine 5'-phosphosulfate sulfotransferase (PAPS reductase)/FAD synthetase
MTDFSIPELIAQNALFVVNHSGGKDSQAMLIMLRSLVPAAQIIIIHAHLAEVEWPGTLEQVYRYAGDIPVHVTRANKTFFEMVEHRQMWPSPSTRQCTSDLKRDPINREIRAYLKEHPEHGGLVVNCMGLRAQESARRAKAATLKLNGRMSKAGRQVYDWLPIHELTEDEVFALITAAGEKPHWAYAAGMSRFSCCFCIMSSKKDLRTANKLRPSLGRRYIATERRIDHTFTQPRKNGPRRFLPEILGAVS